MATASLVIGIICVCVATIPLVGTIVIVPALIGGLFAIIDLASSKKDKKKQNAIPGLVLSILSIFIVVFNINSFILFGNILDGFENFIKDNGNNYNKHVHIYIDDNNMDTMDEKLNEHLDIDDRFEEKVEDKIDRMIEDKLNKIDRLNRI